MGEVGVNEGRVVDLHQDRACVERGAVEDVDLIEDADRQHGANGERNSDRRTKEGQRDISELA